MYAGNAANPVWTTSGLKGTRKAGIERLTDFLPKAGRHYSGSRNFDLGPDDRSNVSLISPWVRHRLVSETEILSAVLKRHSFEAAEKFIQEVFWRAYFKGWLEQHPSVWTHYCERLRGLDVRLDEDQGLRDRYDQAITGRTGIDCFDFWAEELVETGYLHNHARMWFASIWIFTLKLPWELGADFFFRHLLDGDPASNTLSWRWVGGLHTKGKNYVARADNIEKFTDGRFNPRGKLNEDAEPLSENEDHPLVPFREPVEVGISGRVGLVVTAEDCLTETVFPEIEPVSLFVLRNDPRGAERIGKIPADFTQAALSDAALRVNQTYGVEAVEGHGHDALCEWIRTHGFETVCLAYQPVGPIADIVALAENQLEPDGIKFVRRLRDHDRACWPHATKGYFKLKKQIPEILRACQTS